MTGPKTEALRVLLVQARSAGYHLGGQGAAPPLGLMSIAAAAREALPGLCEYRLVDSFFHDDSEIERILGTWKPRVVAISGITGGHLRIEGVAAMTRRVLGRQARILVGGPHASAYPEACLEYPGVDAVVAGEGEVPFIDYLEYLAGARKLEKVRGILRSGRDGPVRHEAAEPIMDLDTLPPPALDLMTPDHYAVVPNDLATIVLPPHRYLPLFTSRGCPFGCTFCHDIFGRRFRGQAVERVVAHMAGLTNRYGISNFHVYDDIFNGRKSRLLDFCREVQRADLDVRIYFSNGLRADTLDREQLEAMGAAGVVYFGAAIETASAKMQDRIRKRMNVARLLENVAIADELGIFTTGFLMLGVPGETREDMETTIETARHSALHYAYFSVLNPYEGTEEGRLRQASGFDVSTGEMPEGYSSSGVNAAGIPEAEFRAIIRSAYRAFWTPKRFLAFAARHPDPGGLAAALVSARTREALLARVGSVLGAKPMATFDNAPWVMPKRTPRIVECAARAAGLLGHQIASGLHKRRIKRHDVPAELLGKIGGR